MHVLITGGAGFLGSHLCDKFLAKGHTVIAMDNLITGSTRNIEHLAGREDFLFIKQDVTNYLYLEGSIDAVLHFASPASPIDYLNLPIQTLKVGALGTQGVGLARPKKPVPAGLHQRSVAIHRSSAPELGPRQPMTARHRNKKPVCRSDDNGYHRYHGVDAGSCASSYVRPAYASKTGAWCRTSFRKRCAASR
jgi:dTDP-glucose 4,6-dehydratase